MKRLLSSLAVTLAIGTGHCALHAQDHHLRPADLTGSWVVTIQEMSSRLVLTQDGTSLTGMLATPHGTIRVSGEVAAGALRFSGASEEAPVIEISARGTTTPDGSLAGTMTVNVLDGELPWTAVRAAAK
jgi:hypothetical protein